MRNYPGSIIKDFSTPRKCDIKITRELEEYPGWLGLNFLEETRMGFRRQPNLWQCGPYALKHALIMLGILVDDQKISQVAGTDTSGTDEKDLAHAARKFGCKLLEIRMKDVGEARRALVECSR